MAKEMAFRFWGAGAYRGYELRTLNWAVNGEQFAVYAYMLNSPLHPMDMMYQASSMDRVYGQNYAIEYLEIHVENAVLSLKALIDKAYENKESFSPTHAEVAPTS